MGGQKQFILLHPVTWLQGIKELKNPKFLNISFAKKKLTKKFLFLKNSELTTAAI